MDNNWLDKLRSSLMNYEEETPPEGLWEGIDNTVNAKLNSRKKRAILLYISSFAAASAIAIYFILTIDPVSKRIENKIALSDIFVGPEYNPIQQSALRTDSYEDENGIYHNCTPAGHSVETSPSEIVKNDVTETAGIIEDIDKEITKQQVEERIITDYTSEREKQIPSQVSKDRKKRLDIGISSSHIFEAASSHSGYGGLYGSDAAMMAQAAISGFGPQRFSDVLINSNNNYITTKIVHRQPVRIGLSIDYWLSNTFGIETGITYSLLVSDLSSGSSETYYNTVQSLNYIGLPLNVNLRIADFAKSNGRLYLSAGGMVEKCFSGKTITHYNVAMKPNLPGIVTKLEVKPLQWSLNAALGCSYAIGNIASFYVEPGISYYFDNSSPVETIYKERPINFSLRAGVRFSIKK